MTVGQFTGQGHTLQSPLANDGVTGGAGGQTRSGGEENLGDDRFGGLGVFLEVHFKGRFNNLVNGRLDLGVVDFGFGLGFKLDFGTGHFDPDDGRETFLEIVWG